MYLGANVTPFLLPWRVVLDAGHAEILKSVMCFIFIFTVLYDEQDE